MEKKIRKSNIKLLRIIAMGLIIASHLSYYGGAYYHTEGIDKFVACLFLTGGKLGVSLFVMIGCIFMTKKNMSFKAVLRLLMTMIVIYMSCTIIFFAVGEPVSFKSLLNPLNKYWFVNVYVGLMLVSPWLKKLMDALDYRSNKNLCIVLTLICAIFPTLRFDGEFTNQFIWFVYLFFLVNFIIRYESDIALKRMDALLKSIPVKLFLLFVACGGGYVFMAYMIMQNEKYFPLRNSGSVIMLVVALTVFVLFYKKKMNYSYIVNWIAKGTFVAYLIHDNQYVRGCLWNDLLKCDLWYTSPFFVLYGLLTIVGILLVGAIITSVVDKIIFFVLDTRCVKFIIDRLDRLFPENLKA